MTSVELPFCEWGDCSKAEERHHGPDGHHDAEVADAGPLVPAQLVHAERGADRLQQDEVEQEDEEGEDASADRNQIWPE